jgi:CDP-glycerol glycerophosphotransferase (TagB/SpsB family)
MIEGETCLDSEKKTSDKKDDVEETPKAMFERRSKTDFHIVLFVLLLFFLSSFSSSPSRNLLLRRDR